MSNTSPTPLERGRQKLISWEASGVGNIPPERDIYTSDRHGISAYIDPFTPFRIGAVVFSHNTAVEGETAHLAEMSYSRRARLALVVHAVGGKLLAASGSNEDIMIVDEAAGEQRVLERADGFAIPTQAHVRMGVAFRGEIDHPKPSEVQLNDAWGLTIIHGEEAQQLDRRLDAISLVGDILDNPMAPGSLEQMERIAATIGAPQ